MGRSESKDAYNTSKQMAQQNQANAQASFGNENKAITDFSKSIDDYGNFINTEFAPGGQFDTSESNLATSVTAGGKNSLQGLFLQCWEPDRHRHHAADDCGDRRGQPARGARYSQLLEPGAFGAHRRSGPRRRNRDAGTGNDSGNVRRPICHVAGWRECCYGQCNISGADSGFLGHVPARAGRWSCAGWLWIHTGSAREGGSNTKTLTTHSLPLSAGAGHEGTQRWCIVAPKNSGVLKEF
jgi:hypothetical protein